MDETNSVKRTYKQVFVSSLLGYWHVPDRYDHLQHIGFGAYGHVCSAFDKERNMKVAIKKIGRPLQTKLHAKRAYREVRMLKHMHHENIIGLLDIFVPDVDGDYDVYLVTHFMNYDLSSILKEWELTESQVRLFVYQLLRGLKYVHSAGIIHRDLKPSNVVVNDNCELRILDFGLARSIEPGQCLTGYVFTRWYRAPELLLNWMQYNQTADIWAVGCIMAEMILRRPLFPGDNQVDQLQKTLEITGTPEPELLNKLTSDEARRYIATLPPTKKRDFRELFSEASPSAIDLLEKMLELDPDKRITAEQALAHEYLEELADVTDEPDSEPYHKSFDDVDLDLSRWRDLILAEVTAFMPPPVEEPDEEPTEQ